MICPLCLQEAQLHVRLHGRALFQCVAPGGCALLFVDPAFFLSPEEERARYETHENSPEDPRYRAFLAQATDPLLERLPPGAQGLDFGCGPGPTLSRIMEEAGHPCRNYDPFFFPDAEALNQVYDFVACTETVEHMHDPRKGFAILDALLAPGGWLVVMTQWVPQDRPLDRWVYLRDPTHVAFFREETLAWVARWRGWEVSHPSPRVTLFCKPTEIEVE